MSSLLQRVPLVLVTLGLLAVPQAWGQVPCPCVAPNVGGTAELMPVTCTSGYLGFMQISDGLPAGATIDCNAELHTFLNTNEAPGGSLGGNTQTWDASLTLQMTGTGALAGFNRFITVPVAGISDSGPRTPGDAVQTFPHHIVNMFGQLFGDPDFCTFEIEVGPPFALPPSVGSTTLTRLGPPGSDFQVDSFFDVHYKITFQGCPGSTLEGMNGTTENIHRLELCQAPVPVEETTWGGIKLLYQ